MKDYTAILRNAPITFPTDEQFIHFRDAYGLTAMDSWLDTAIVSNSEHHRFVNVHNRVSLDGHPDYYLHKGLYLMKIPSEVEGNRFKAFGRLWKRIDDEFAFYKSDAALNYMTHKENANMMNTLNPELTEVEELTCSHCGAVIENEDDAYYTDDGEVFCCEDCLHEGGYEICGDCGIIIDESDAVYVDGEEYYVCGRCYERDYFTCDSCNEVYHNNDCAGHTRDDQGICDNCANDYYRCADCDCLIHYDDAVCIDDEWYCPSCADERDDRSHILGYHDHECTRHYSEHHRLATNGNEIVVRGGDGELDMGFELEIDNGHNPGELATWITENYTNKLFCCRDGSLSEDGIEIISIPASLEWHMKYGNYEELLDKCMDYGYEDGATSTGLHVHVSRDGFGNTEKEIKLAISKLIILMNKYWDLKMIPFTRRKKYNVERWAKKNAFDIGDKDEFIHNVHDVTANAYDRYSAINLCNSNTVEFRIFRGTLDYDTLIATLQFVHRMCQLAKTISIEELMSLDWATMTADWTEEPLHAYMMAHTTAGEPQNFKFIEKKMRYTVKTWEEMKRDCEFYDEVLKLAAFTHYCMKEDWPVGFGEVVTFDPKTNRVTFVADGRLSDLFYDVEMLNVIEEEEN